MNGSSGQNDVMSDLVLIAFVLPVALGLATSLLAKASHRVLDLLVTHHVLVANPVLALPGTGYGLDQARLVILGGAVIALVVAVREHARRQAEQ